VPDPDPEVAARVREMAKVLESLGHLIDEVDDRAAAADPKEERRWRAARDNYKRQLTMGQQRMSDTATKAAETRRR
jgi:hypothetical protein